MSGGSFEYAYNKIDDFTDTLREKIREEVSYNPKVDDIMKGYLEEFRKLSRVAKAIEWYYSGDTADDSFLEIIDEIERKYNNDSHKIQTTLIKQEKETSMELKEKIKVMQAAERGEKIELKYKTSSNPTDWIDVTNQEWNWYLCDYRVKETPNLKPSDLKGKWLRANETSIFYLVTGFDDVKNIVMIGDVYDRSLTDLARKFRYGDGSEIKL